MARSSLSEFLENWSRPGGRWWFGIIDEIGSIRSPGFVRFAREQFAYLRFHEPGYALDRWTIRHHGAQSQNLFVAFMASLRPEYITDNEANSKTKHLGSTSSDGAPSFFSIMSNR